MTRNQLEQTGAELSRNAGFLRLTEVCHRKLQLEQTGAKPKECSSAPVAPLPIYRSGVTGAEHRHLSGDWKKDPLCGAGSAPAENSALVQLSTSESEAA